MAIHGADIVIIGGGPTGLATAIALRDAGADVLVADGQEPPIDKSCGEGLMPDSRFELSRLGIELSDVHGAPFDGICFADNCSSVTANFAHGQGLGMRRLALHRLLIDRCAAIGVRMLWKASIELRSGQKPMLGGSALSYRYLIGADGEASGARRWAGLDSGVRHSRRFGYRAHFELTERLPRVDKNYVEVHWGDVGQAYVTPIGERKVCVAVISHSQRPQIFYTAINAIPALRESLSIAKQSTPLRGAVTTTSRIRRVVRDNVALIGDASGSADAITGEGLAMGFRQAFLLRDSILAGDLNRYQLLHPKILQVPQQMARAMLMMDRHAGFRRRILKAFAADPKLFVAALRVHFGEENLSSTLLRHGVEFGSRLLSTTG